MNFSFVRFFACIAACLLLAGCASAPKGFLRPAEGYLEKRQAQTRQYRTTDEERVINAVAGVLQDMGFILDNSETKLGMVSASKKADAVDMAQIAGAFIIDVLAASGGVYSNSTSQCDKTQLVKASVVARAADEGDKTTVRVTFQRIVRNMNDQVSRVETIGDEEIYRKFYEGLSKAVFLEAQGI